MNFQSTFIQKIFQVWKLQSILENLPEIKIRNPDGSFLKKFSQEKLLLQNGINYERVRNHLIGATPEEIFKLNELIKQLVKQKRFTQSAAEFEEQIFITQVYLGVISPENFYKLIDLFKEISQEKEINKNEEFKEKVELRHLFIFSFFLDLEEKTIYSSVTPGTGENSNDFLLASFCLPPLWFYINAILKKEPLPSLQEIRSAQENVFKIVEEIFIQRGAIIKFPYNHWIIEPSFLITIGGYTFNPLIELAKKSKELIIYFPKGVLDYAEQIAPYYGKKANFFLKGVTYLKEFKKVFEKQYHEFETVFIQEIVNSVKTLIEQQKQKVRRIGDKTPKQELASLIQPILEKVFLNFKNTEGVLILTHKRKNVEHLRKPNNWVIETSFPWVKIDLLGKDFLTKNFFLELFKVIIDEAGLNTLIETGIKHDININSFTVANSWLIKKKDIQNELVSFEELNFPSFFLEDLDLVEKNYSEETYNYPGMLRFYLERRIGIKLTDRNELEQLLSPENIPYGRWVKPEGQFPFLNQYFSIIAATKEIIFSTCDVNSRPVPGELISVNGPPGTGKTTLLGDFFANLIVKKSLYIAEKIYEKENNRKEKNLFYKFFKSALDEDVTDEKGEPVGKYYFLDPYLSSLVAVVVSANNTAVENITKELPLYKRPKQKDLDERTLSTKYPMYKRIQEVFCNYEDKRLLSRVEKLVEKCLKSISEDKKESEDFSIPEELFYTEENTDEIAYFPCAAILGKATNTCNFIKSLCLYRNFSKTFWINQEDFPEKTDSDLKDFKNRSKILNEKLKNVAQELLDIVGEINEIKKAIYNWQKEYDKNPNGKEIKTILKTLSNLLDIDFSKKSQEEILQLLYPQKYIIPFFLSTNEEEEKKAQLFCPYRLERLKELQEKAFLTSIKLILWFICYFFNAIKNNLDILYDYKINNEDISSEEKLKSGWGCFFLLFPIISSTFHSIERLFDSIVTPGSFLVTVVDEAGQAPAYFPCGIFYRTRNALVVGDPLQLEPVVTIPPSLIEKLVNNTFNSKRDLIDCEVYISGYGKAIQIGDVKIDASVQTLADRGALIKGNIPFKEGQEIQVGIPLRVHFRCKPKIMEISNQIAYGGFMVHFKNEFNTENSDDINGIVKWIDVPKENFDRVLKNCCLNEVETAEKLIEFFVKEKEIDPWNICIISPFKDVVKKARNGLKRFYEIYKKKGKDYFSQIGTVHTFQGKQSKIVIIILGGNTEKAREWVVKKPNLINVAVTRAQEELYIIGHYKNWKDLMFESVIKVTGSPVFLDEIKEKKLI